MTSQPANASSISFYSGAPDYSPLSAKNFGASGDANATLKALQGFLSGKKNASDHPYLPAGATDAVATTKAMQQLLLDSGSFKNLPPPPPGKTDADGLMGERTRTALRQYLKDHSDYKGPVNGGPLTAQEIGTFAKLTQAAPATPLQSSTASPQVPQVLPQRQPAPNYKAMDANLGTGKPSAAVTPRPVEAASNIRSTKDGDIATVHLQHSPGQTGEVALFIPKGFDPTKPAVIMPYLHGFGGGIDDAFERQKLAELAAKSGKNVAFVIPQLGSKSDIKAEYRNPAYAGQFLDESSRALSDLYTRTHAGADPAKTSQAFQNMPVVPLSYSGGFDATLPLLSQSRVKGVTLLDSMYSDAAPFTNFSRRADKPFVSVIYGSTTEKHSQDFLQSAPQGTAFVTPKNGTHTALVQDALPGVLGALSITDGKVSYAGAQNRAQIASVNRNAPSA